MNGVYLLRLQNIQKRINEAGLRFGLEYIPPKRENKPEFSLGKKSTITLPTYIFQIQFSLASIIRIWVEGRLYAVSESSNVHLVPKTGPPAPEINSRKEK